MTCRTLSLVFSLLIAGSGVDAGEAATSVPAGQPLSSTVVSLDGDQWLLATDSKNEGREAKWFEAPRPEAKPTKVPWIIQEVFPGQHGVAWYWRDFTVPRNPHDQGCYLLRFWAVDYKADVWLNGVPVGQHEGGEDPFVLDVTGVVKPDAPNRIAVRVLNPSYEPIDGIVLGQTPRRNKTHPYTPGSDYNYGGVTDSVELLVTPAVRVQDLFARPDPATGEIRLQLTAVNAGKSPVKVRLHFAVAPAASGETLDVAQVERELPPGETQIEAALLVAQPHFWDLNDPYLYRVSARATADGSRSFDEQSARCGFRDFRFADGCFRLNGRRLYLKSSHTGAGIPFRRVK